MHNEYVEVARFFSSSDAHILRALLETEDIKVEIFDEQFSSLTPVDSVIAGGIKLVILNSDIDKAEPIIQGYYNNLKIEAGNVCPECNSLDVKKDYVTQFTMFCYATFGAILGTGFNRNTPQYKRCNSCGYKW
jgi:DNA-directed RNA polymerase subunit RPC12/RpoP